MLCRHLYQASFEWVSVDDIGQGSEAIRILGVKWLPTGAAGRAVDSDGNLKKSAKNKDDGNAQPESEEQSTSAMEADEG
ncbi:hypothetical protein MRB53_037272 [Persea americana]|nr:hypothetical protein MRB53_037272 [Persea americana]